MVYSEKMLNDFALQNGLELALFTKTNKGRRVPCFEIGDGDKMVVITSRHHACESTGTYVLQGFAEACLKKRIEGIKFLFVPFVDYDGVVDGDAGKGRLPHDHNRDYGETILYNETAKLRNLADGGKVIMNFDFHSPHHDGWINDYPYLMKFSSEDNPIYNELFQKLRKFTQADENSMTYTGEQDIEYGAKWNEKTTEHNRNYFLPRTLKKVSILMEIPYFGLNDNPFTQERAIALGNHVYKAVYDLLSE